MFAMKVQCLLWVLLVFAFGRAQADATHIRMARIPDGDISRLKGLPLPAKDDAASRGVFTLIRGTQDGNSGGVSVLTDGKLPRDEDSPKQNFFLFGKGMLLLDLQKVTEVMRISTFSWHPLERAPQVYTVYGNDQGTPDRVEDVTGWRTIARVDTRQKEQDRGGFYAVSIDREKSPLGRYRFLLFKIEPTGRGSANHTFYSEIDVVSSEDRNLTYVVPGENLRLFRFSSKDGTYRFAIDYTDAPELEEWSKQKLAPVVAEWYGKLVGLLPSEEFTPRREIKLLFKDDMGGTPAYAAGGEISMNHRWFVSEQQREAIGCVVHEMTHVVQDYGRGRKHAPGWLTEGIADYTRWFLYEPQTNGARITRRHGDVRYNNSYRVTANFLDWCQRKYNRELVRILNAAARAGQYDEALWKEATGRTVQELGEEWKRELPER